MKTRFSLWLVLIALFSLGVPWFAMAQPKVLRMGMPPYYEPARLVKVNKPFLDYLEAELGMPVQVYTRADYRSFAQAAEDGAFDFVVAVPHIVRYLELNSSFNVVAAVEDNDPFLVLTRKGVTLDDLQLKSVVRVAVPDTLSLAAASVTFWSDEALPDADIQLVDAQSLRNSLSVLIEERADVVFMVSRGLFLAGVDMREKLNVVDSGVTATHLNVFAVNPKLAQPIRKKLIAAILALPGSPARQRFGMPPGERPFVLKPDLSIWDRVLRRNDMAPDFSTP